MPIVATAVPNNPECSSPLDAPSLYDAMIAAEMVNVGSAVHSSATANPAMMLVAGPVTEAAAIDRSEEHTSELQSQSNIVCRLLLEKKKNIKHTQTTPPLLTAR